MQHDQIPWQIQWSSKLNYEFSLARGLNLSMKSFGVAFETSNGASIINYGERGVNIYLFTYIHPLNAPFCGT